MSESTPYSVHLVDTSEVEHTVKGTAAYADLNDALSAVEVLAKTFALDGGLRIEVECDG